MLQRGDLVPHSRLTRTLDFADQETACLITSDRVAGIPFPAALVADRRRHIVFITKPDTGTLPVAQDLFGGTEYVQSRCPKCRGRDHMTAQSRSPRPGAAPWRRTLRSAR